MWELCKCFEIPFRVGYVRDQVAFSCAIPDTITAYVQPTKFITYFYVTFIIHITEWLTIKNYSQKPTRRQSTHSVISNEITFFRFDYRDNFIEVFS